MQLAQTHDLRALGLREIGRMIDADNPIHPQKVKYHLEKLNILGKKPVNRKKRAVVFSDEMFFSIPIFGVASCGPAAFFADNKPTGHLQISKRLFNAYSPDLFAVQAIGFSLNRANIKGKSIDSGDYVIVDPNKKDFQNGDYVFSKINGLANIKKFHRTPNSKGIALISESTKNIPPIFIHEKDLHSYVPMAKVIDVLKVSNSNHEDLVAENN